MNVNREYQQVLDYLYQTLPMFQRIGGTAFNKNLDRTISFLDHLDNPQTKFKSIHVAGTNGKGTSSHMIASVLQEVGVKVGLYTSPHLIEFTERIKINGQEATQDFVVQFVMENRAFMEKLKPSFFETTVAMAFQYFAAQEVDIAVIEVGMGGRLDSTNVIHPEIALITYIGYDHQQFLGETLEEIAKEKAGIIKSETPVVLGKSQPELISLFKSVAQEKSAPLYSSDKIEVEGRDGLFRVDNSEFRIEDIQTDLKGDYIRLNLPGVIKVLELIRQKFSIDESHLIRGLGNTVGNTGLKGRWQIISKKPLAICDTGHNEDGIQLIFSQISQMEFKKLHVVWGMVSDKLPDKLLKLLPSTGIYYFCRPSIPRGLDADQLYSAAREKGLDGTVYSSVREAWRAALRKSDFDDLIFVGGSTFVVADLLSEI